MPPSWARDTVTVIQRTATGTDTYGNDTYTETPVAVAGCRIQPIRSDEQLGGIQQVTTRWRLYGPADMPVTALDEIEWNGTRYEVDGEPEQWPSPTGHLAHTEIILKKVTG